MGKYIRTLTVTFDAEISQQEIPLFRGAVLQCLGPRADLLYHNHTGDATFRYAYPLIQYKRLRGKAAIVCVEQGTDVIGQYLTESAGRLRIGEREVMCETHKLVPARLRVQTWQSQFTYTLRRWLPLNSDNYRLFRAMEHEGDRRALLEQILKGNLLSMLKGLDIWVEDEVTATIVQLSEPYIQHSKGVALMAFDATFVSNLSIPDHIGIGKYASRGYGIIRMERPQKETAPRNTTPD